MTKLRAGILAVSLAGNFLATAYAAPEFVNFDGINQTAACGDCLPPDTTGAVGNTQFVQIVNERFLVYSKTPAPGTTAPSLLKSVSLATIFNYTTETLFDPRVLYDAHGKRWVIAAEALPEPSGVQLQFLAVSRTSDATGIFDVYSINVNFDTKGDFWDFPQLGISTSAILLTGNYFPQPGVGPFLRSTLISIDKNSLYKQKKLSFKRFNLTDGSVAPPNVLDRNKDVYLISSSPSGRVADSVLNLYTLASAGSKDILSGPVPIPVAPFSIAPDALQPGTGAVLDSGDPRFANTSTQISNNLWQVHTIAAASGSRAIARFYLINTATNFVAKIGDISKSPTSFNFNASIAANDANTAFVTWTATDVNTQAQVRASSMVDEESSFPSGSSLFKSPTFYNPSGTNVRERWGDYSAITIDPIDTRRAWGTNQKNDSETVWGSRIFNLSPGLYVADTSNNRIEIFSVTGQFQSEFGSFGFGDGQFVLGGLPGGVAVDTTRIYVTDESTNNIQIFSRAGDFISAIRSPSPTETATCTQSGGFLCGPKGIAVDDSRIYVTTSDGLGVVKVFDKKSGAFIFSFGITSTQRGPGQLVGAAGIAVDDSNIYVADWGHSDVQIFTKTGIFVSGLGTFTSPTGNFGTEPGKFNGPFDVTIDDSQIYVADSGNNRIEIFTKDGAFVSTFGSSGSGDGQLAQPRGIAVDGEYIYVSDSSNNRIQKFTKTGVFVSATGTFGARKGEFDFPWGITVSR